VVDDGGIEMKRLFVIGWLGVLALAGCGGGGDGPSPFGSGMALDSSDCLGEEFYDDHVEFCANAGVADDTARPGVSAEDCDDPADLTVAEWTEFCSEQDEAVDEESGPPRSQRGNIVKAIGEAGGISDLTTGRPVVTFTVDAITADAPCTSAYADGPVNGHFVAVDLRVTTDPALPSDWYYSISPFDFSFVGPDGITVPEVATMESYSCLAGNEQWSTDTLSPGSTYVGTIVVDVPSPTGTLIYRASTSGGSDGWEWSF
jgi:hypothetical protein